MRWLCGLAVLCLAAASSFAFTAEQAARGKEVFGNHCAVCHGESGQGGDVPAQFAGLAGWHAPRLIGEGALPEMPRPEHRVRLAPFQTAADVLGFVSAAMPAQDPGSLEKGQYLDVTAYLLEANGMRPDGKPFDEEQAEKISLAGLRRR